jgi:hypothetical protein
VEEAMKVNFQDKDFNKIIDFMSLVGVSALNISHPLGKEEPDLEDSPTYSKTHLTITIPANMDEEKLKYALLHELGHHLVSAKDKFSTHWLIQLGSYQEETIDQIYAEEVQAWKNADKVASILGIKLSPEYEEFKALCLKTYENQFNDFHKEQVNPLKGKLKKPTDVVKKSVHQCRGVLKFRG